MHYLRYSPNTTPPPSLHDLEKAIRRRQYMHLHQQMMTSWISCPKAQLGRNSRGAQATHAVGILAVPPGMLYCREAQALCPSNPPNQLHQSTVKQPKNDNITGFGPGLP